MAAPPAAAPPQAPPPVVALPPPPPNPPCLDAIVVPVLDQLTGAQLVDLATGLPMWLISGDDSGLVLLGTTCPRADVPLALPATGDGSTATEFTDTQGGPALVP